MRGSVFFIVGAHATSFVFLSSRGTIMIRVTYCRLLELMKEIKEENKGEQKWDIQKYILENN